MKIFTQSATLTMDKTVGPGYLEILPDAIYKHTHLDYSYQQKSSGCLLRPTFRKMLYKNSFVPEIDIEISYHDSQTIMQMIGQPIKFVRAFMTFWFSALLILEALFCILALTSMLDSFLFVFLPLMMGVFGYLLCKLATKATFHTVVTAMREEFL